MFDLPFCLAVCCSAARQTSTLPGGPCVLSQPMILCRLAGGVCPWQRLLCGGSFACCRRSLLHTYTQAHRAGGGLQGLLAWGGHCALKVLSGCVLLWMCWRPLVQARLGWVGWRVGWWVLGVYFIQGWRCFGSMYCTHGCVFWPPTRVRLLACRLPATPPPTDLYPVLFASSCMPA